MAEYITIHTEKEAFEFLDKLNKGQVKLGNQQLKFEGWPTMHIYLKGDKFDSTITPTVMKGILELQKIFISLTH